MAQTLISIKDGSVMVNGYRSLDAIELTVSKGQHWAITGASGSGKTTLLQVIAGQKMLNHGKIEYFLDDSPHSPALTHIHDKVLMVGLKHHFRDLTNTTSFYYQQRYNSSDAENSATVADYIDNIQPKAGSGDKWTKDLIISRFHLDVLLNKHLIKLSNGETRRLLIAVALLHHPVVLLLDNPFTGLDVDARQELNKTLSEIADSGINLIISASVHALPDVITHVAVLNQGRLIDAGEKSGLSVAPEKSIEADADNLQTINKLYALRYTKNQYQHLINMQHVNISYNHVNILRDISWQVLPGERWSLSGPNGAGKSTLLSLINGDNPQAYANDIVLFDRKRGSGESIWDIKKNIGFISPELFQYFPADQSCLQVVESGYFDTLGLFRPSNAKQAAEALEWLKALKVDQYARKLFKNIPAGAQRLCLLARALVKSPPLLILDEPCQGLDDEQQLNFKRIIDSICEATPVGLIYVTHYVHEIPQSVTHHLKLIKGSVASSV